MVAFMHGRQIIVTFWSRNKESPS